MPYARGYREKFELPNWLRKAFGMKAAAPQERPRVKMPEPVKIPAPGYSDITPDDAIDRAIARFKKMGVRLILQKDADGFRVETEPKVYFIKRDRSTRAAESCQGWGTAARAFKYFDEDVANKCRDGTQYIDGQCRLLVEDKAHGDFKVWALPNGSPIDTGLRVSLAAKGPKIFHI